MRLPVVVRLRLHRLGALLLLFHLEQQRAVDVWQYTSKRNGGLDKRVQFLVTADSELEMARRDALDLEILGGVACKFEHFGGQVLENGGQVDAGFGADARLLARNGTKVALYATAGELQGRGHVSASFLCAECENRCAGWWLGDDALYRAATHLETRFGRVRLCRLDVRIALSSCLASRLSCRRCQLLQAPMARLRASAYLFHRQPCRMSFTG
ncbi:hypothetical protein J1614_004999 [Plenodomus biglobosus]|nr:hypothetical protein J1614_004999 [Plenodomus biglobosus]